MAGAVDLEGLDVPTGRPVHRIDVRSDPPPEPLRRTLETLADLEDDVVLVQVSDRRPKHLLPKLSDRGYEYASDDRGETVVTAVWRP